MFTLFLLFRSENLLRADHTGVVLPPFTDRRFSEKLLLLHGALCAPIFAFTNLLYNVRYNLSSGFVKTLKKFAVTP